MKPKNKVLQMVLVIAFLVALSAISQQVTLADGDEVNAGECKSSTEQTQLIIDDYNNSSNPIYVTTDTETCGKTSEDPVTVPESPNNIVWVNVGCGYNQAPRVQGTEGIGVGGSSYSGYIVINGHEQWAHTNLAVTGCASPWGCTWSASARAQATVRWVIYSATWTGWKVDLAHNC